MAPGRRKDSNRVTAVGQLNLGDLVLAKVKGYPAWPAKISRPEDFDQSPDPRKYFVQFFGTTEVAFVVPADIQVFTDESKSKLVARCQGKTVKYFASAVEQICEAFEKLNKKQSAESVLEVDISSASTAAAAASFLITDFADDKPPVEHNGTYAILEMQCTNVNLKIQDVNVSSDQTSSDLDGAEYNLKNKKSSNNDHQSSPRRKVVVSKSIFYHSSGKEKLMTTCPDDGNKEMISKLEIKAPLQEASVASGLNDCSDFRTESTYQEKDTSNAFNVQDNASRVAMKKKVLVSKSSFYASSCKKKKSVSTNSDDSKNSEVATLPKLEVEKLLSEGSVANRHDNCGDSIAKKEHQEKDASNTLKEITSTNLDDSKNTDIATLPKLEVETLLLDVSAAGGLDNCGELIGDKDHQEKVVSHALNAEEVCAQDAMKKKVVSRSSFSVSPDKEKLVTINPDDIMNDDLIMSPKLQIEEVVPQGLAAGGLQICSDLKGESDHEEEDANNALKVEEIGQQTTKWDTEPEQNKDNVSRIDTGAALAKKLKGFNGKVNKLPGGRNRKVASCDSNREPSGNITKCSDSKIGKMLKNSKEHFLEKGKMHNVSCKETIDTSHEYANEDSMSSVKVKKNLKDRNKRHKLEASKDGRPAKIAKSVQEDCQIDVKDKYGKIENSKKSGIPLRSENQLTSATSNGSLLPTVKHTEDTGEVADSATKTTATKVKTESCFMKYCDRQFGTYIQYKRRSRRLVDAEELEVIRTPIRNVSSGNLVLADSGISEEKPHLVIGTNKDSPSNNCMTEKTGSTRDEKSPDGMTLPFGTTGTSEKKAEISESPQISQSPMKQEYKRSTFGNSRPLILSPDATTNLDYESKSTKQTSAKPHVRPLSSSRKKLPVTPSKLSNCRSHSLNLSHSHSVPEKITASNKSVRVKTLSKSNIHNTVLTDSMHDNRYISHKNPEKVDLGENRSGKNKTEKVSTLNETLFSDPSKSMRHLIAVAQAKRKEAQLQCQHSENSIPTILSTPNLIHGKSPSPAAMIPYTSINLSHQDMKGDYASILDSPSVHGNTPHEPSQTNKIDHEEYEHRISPEYRPEGSLSCGIEAAVARDAFEGMIETLSRTKDSIGRATRLAIDCAKFGIASEIVELLIQKLENEPNFHRRVDLLFLVDSITQCSHTQKGIAGSSYIPRVQASLPRLLTAAAPSGASACENRRQCVKVLRLWIQRKIMPDSFLRRYIDEIDVPSDDISSGVFLRHRSQADRSVDDPIREMEGMQVDEYGSNATFQLTGLFSCHIFQDEEDSPINLFRNSAVKMSVEATSSLKELDTCAVMPKLHPIEKVVNGELEMKDAILPKEDKGITRNNSDFSGSLEPTLTNPSDLPPLPPVPPPPVDPPPPPADPPPPLPPSPPPLPPPLPSSPSTPPPPPPPPLHPPGHTFMPSIPVPPLSSSYSFSMLNSQMQEKFRVSNANEMAHVHGNMTLRGQDASLSIEVVSQQQPNFMTNGMRSTQFINTFTSSRPFEYGQNELYVAPQNSYPIQHFQQSNAPFHQGPYHPLPPRAPSNFPLATAQMHSDHFSHAIRMNQPVQQLHNPYPMSSVPSSQRPYLADEPRRVHTGGFSPDNQHSAMVSAPRPSCSGAPILQDGFPRSDAEWPSSNSMGFPFPLQNSIQSAVAVQGQDFHHDLSGRQNISGLDCWRSS
ncbi:ENHANCER OF AG-4 protein 2-like [Zingiber officinale]|uniref:ENHANCER OF AG-4 protein 2-like n=1 Tax=Zingiber officinale TaxID=94328 RepID=UPI001C4AF888|nr:ENHANCER OF AG-4 protein 2-like [Zingiber officinale]